MYVPRIEVDHGEIRVEGLGFRGVIHLGERLRGKLHGNGETSLAEPLVFENYLRILAAYAALQQGGLFLHSAGVVAGNRAYLFLGLSNAGKTTMARMALKAGARVLSDDANVLLPAGSGIYEIGPVPFAGELRQPPSTEFDSFPVAGLFWLEKSDSLQISTLEPAAQHARMLACCSALNTDGLRFDRLMEVLGTLLARIPLRTLAFPRRTRFEYVLPAMEAACDAQY